MQQNYYRFRKVLHPCNSHGASAARAKNPLRDSDAQSAPMGDPNAASEAKDTALLSRLTHQQQSSVKAWVDGELPRAELTKRNSVWTKASTRVWYGQSAREHKDTVKELCRGPPDGPSMCDFDFERKVWGTCCLEAVPKLVASRMWAPDGLPLDLARFVAVEAWNRCEKKRVKQAERDANASVELKRKEKKEALQRLTTRAEAERREREAKERMLNIPPTTEQDYLEAEAWGFSREFVDASASFAQLGPRGGPSTWSRVKRWFALAKLNEHLPTVGKSYEVVKAELFQEFERRTAAATEAAQRRERDATQSTEDMEVDAEGGLAGMSKELQYECFEEFEKRFRRDGLNGSKEEDQLPGKSESKKYTPQYKLREEEEARNREYTGLNVILANAQRMQAKLGKQPEKRPTLLRCPECSFTPTMEQFLECMCSKGSFDWHYCVRCSVNSHPDKLPCRCETANS